MTSQLDGVPDVDDEAVVDREASDALPGEVQENLFGHLAVMVHECVAHTLEEAVGDWFVLPAELGDDGTHVGNSDRKRRGWLREVGI